MKKEVFLSQVRGGLIVSCQALKDEPLYSSFIMLFHYGENGKGGRNGGRCRDSGQYTGRYY